jgi:hypothetical protein
MEMVRKRLVMLKKGLEMEEKGLEIVDDEQILFKRGWRR